MGNFTINVNRILTHGLETVDFDPSKVALSFDETRMTYNQCSSRTIIYKYVDNDLTDRIDSINFSTQWGDTFVRTSHSGYGDKRNDCLILKGYRESKLRKRPNSGGFTKNSIEKAEVELAKLDRYTLEYATNQFKLLVEEFNAYYVEKQNERVMEAFSTTDGWNFETDVDLVALDLKTKVKEAELRELREIRFQKKNDLMIDFIDNDSSVFPKFRQPLIEAITKKREEGFKNNRFI